MAFDENLNPNETNGKTGKRLTILSIDGGGVRGIIPARILQELERYLALEEKEQLKAGESNETHHLWEYFDMIAGTSSGGLITAMITTRRVDDQQVPTCNASEVVAFFEKDAVTIFPEIFTDEGRIGRFLEAVASVAGPIYRADNLKALLEKKFGKARLSRALTSVIIPAFDTENEVPVFFSNLKSVDIKKPLYNVLVRDACQATTAVPVFFPAACFNEQVSGDPNQSGRPIKEFNVIDGGIAVNDPDFRNVLVLSLGTGQHPMRFVAKPHWSSLEWLLNPSGLPLLSSFFSASGDMVEYYTSMIFDAHQSGHHYLRIQTDCLPTSEFWEIDDATEQNLEKLKDTANELLKLPVSKRNFATGKLDAITDGGSNAAALHRFARWLVEKRRERQRQQPTADSSKGETSRTRESPGPSGPRRRRSPRDEKEGPDETLRDGTAPSTAGAVQMAVGRCCLMMGAAILVFVFVVPSIIFALLQVIYGGF